MSPSSHMRDVRGTVLVVLASVAVITGGGIGVWHATQGGGGGAAPGTANVWIDSDGGTCARSSTAGAYSDAAACSTGPAAYQVASKGDVVLVKTTGGKAITSITSQWFFTNAMKKGGSGNCNWGTQSLADCIWIKPESGSINPNVNTDPQLRICSDFLRLSGLNFTENTTMQDILVSKNTVGIGAGDNQCGTTPPHDILIDGSTFRGAGGIAGGSYNTWIANSTWAFGREVPWQMGGQGNNGLITGVHDSGFDNVDFQGYNMIYSNDPDHHAECLHMDFTGTHNTVRNSRFSGCPVYSIRVEAEGSGENRQINHVIENNFFDQGAANQSANLNFDCHDNNCAITGNTVRFNSFSGGTFGPTNDCAQIGGQTCTQTGNNFYGNIAGSCPSNGAIFALGWVPSYNVYTGSQSGICTGDSTSLYSQTVTYTSAGSPNYNLHLSGSSQGADDLVPTSAQCPAADIDATARPADTNCDAGADERTFFAGFGTGGSNATCPQSPCATGTTTNFTVATNDGAGLAKNWASQLYVPGGLSGAAPLVIYFAGPINTPGAVNWSSVANNNRIIVLKFWTSPGAGSYHYASLHPSQTTSTCGAGGASLCDDKVALLATINYVKANWSIDATKLYGLGDSKGGTMTREAMCGPTTNPLFRGFAPASSPFQSNTENTPFVCEAVANGNRDFSLEYLWGSGDTFGLYTGANKVCASSGSPIIEPGCQDAARGRWIWAPVAGMTQARTDYGCTATNTVTTFGPTSKLVRTVWDDCPVGVRAVASMKVTGAGHAYDGLILVDSFQPGEESYTWLSTH